LTSRLQSFETGKLLEEESPAGLAEEQGGVGKVTKKEILDYWSVMAESRLPLRLFGSVVRRISVLRLAAG
jgi:hypothetical protein